MLTARNQPVTGRRSQRHQPVLRGLVAAMGSGVLAAALVAIVLSATGRSSEVTVPAPPTNAATASDVGAPPGTAPPAIPVATTAAPMVVAVVLHPAPAGPSEIPPAALIAYQRAAAAMQQADAACGLRWEQLAGVGQVLGAHGQADGSTLTAEGLVQPALYGGLVREPTGAASPDSDAGTIDHDALHDRAIGPMSLPPATWATVGIDADNDGRRDPQDLDDAALAVGVLLCGGTENVQQPRGFATALRSLSDSNDFINAVLAASRAYQTAAASQALLTAPPITATPATTPTPSTHVSGQPGGPAHHPAQPPPSTRTTAAVTVLIDHGSQPETVLWTTHASAGADAPETPDLPSCHTVRPSPTTPSPEDTLSASASTSATVTPTDDAAPSNGETAHQPVTSASTSPTMAPPAAATSAVGANATRCRN